VTTGDSIGLLQCHGTRAGDVVAQAMAMSNGDNVTGVFMPVIPGSDVIAQAKPAGGIECLILLHRYTDGN
jgi:hypothetical protein